MNRDELIISTRYGDIDKDEKCEKVTLIGIHQDKNSPYVISLQLLIEKNDKKLSFNINMEGYQFNLFLGDFIKNNSDQILISGQYGGSGGYAIFRIYEFKNSKLRLILDNENLYKQLKCNAKYVDNYKLDINCEKTNKDYTIDISENFKEYLDLVYDENKNVLNGVYPIISNTNTIYPIMVSYNSYYYLQIQQRIVGVSNGDILGAIQSVIEVNEKSKISIKEQYYLLIDRNDM